jgi:leader peptidase (prepilin peptidase)/N-methyltransferase
MVLAAVEALLVWRIGPTAALAAFAYLGAVGTVVSLVDLRTRRLPNRVVLPSYPVTLALLVVASEVQGRWWPLGRAVIAAAVVAGFYLALGLAFPHGLGLGDAKLGGLLALGLGWWGWTVLTTGVLAGWCLAALVLVARYGTRPATRGQPIALGPWLCLGALAAIAAR